MESVAENTQGMQATAGHLDSVWQQLVCVRRLARSLSEHKHTSISFWKRSGTLNAHMDSRVITSTPDLTYCTRSIPHVPAPLDVARPFSLQKTEATQVLPCQKCQETHVRLFKLCRHGIHTRSSHRYHVVVELRLPLPIIIITATGPGSVGAAPDPCLCPVRRALGAPCRKKL